MALPAGANIEVRTTGSDTNGGGFNAARGGIDYSQQDSPQASGTASSSGTTVTATTGIFTSQMVGNYITNGAVWKEITAFTSSTVVTVDSAPSWTSASIKVGGALASPGQAGAIWVAGNIIYLKSGTYNIDMSNTVNTSGGRVSFTAESGLPVMSGFGSTRNDRGTRPVLFANVVGSAGLYLISATGNHNHVEHVEVDCNSKASTGGINATGNYGGGAISCLVRNSTYTQGLYANYAYCCGAISCTGTYGLYVGGATKSEARGCSGIGIGLSEAGSAYHCLATGNNVGIGHASYGDLNIIGNTVHGNTSHGIQVGADYNGSNILGNLVTKNGGWGISGNNAALFVAGNFFGAGSGGSSMANTSGNYQANVRSLNNTSLTSNADPYVNSASNNYALNPSGTDFNILKNAGYPGLFAGGLTTSYPDPGAVQHQDSGGGVKAVRRWGFGL